MPTAPYNTKCSMLGCANPRSRMNSFCMEHGGKDKYEVKYEHAKLTPEAKAFKAAYSTPFWRSFRLTQLSRQPLCQACLTRGIVTAAAEVDHLFPWSKLGKAAFRHNVFQSLCRQCHHHKTVREQRGYIEHYINNQTIVYELEQYAQVMSRHAENGAKT